MIYTKNIKTVLQNEEQKLDTIVNSIEKNDKRED